MIEMGLGFSAVVWAEPLRTKRGRESTRDNLSRIAFRMDAVHLPDYRKNLPVELILRATEFKETVGIPLVDYGSHDRINVLPLPAAGPIHLA
jgi:hypothetical protein